MTETTDKRQITLLVQSVMKKHNLVDDKGNLNLQIEMDFVGAFHGYFEARLKSDDKPGIRERLSIEYGLLGDLGISDTVLQRARMTQILQDTLRLNVDENAPAWERVITFCIQAEAKGQTVKQYQAWRERDVYNSPKSHQISNDPSMIIKTWPQADYSVAETQQPKSPDGSFYG